MRCLLAVLVALSGSFLSFAADEKPTKNVILSDRQIAAGSISALLRSGKARFVSDEKEEIERFKKALSERAGTHRLEAKLHSLQASLVDNFDERQGRMIRERTVTLLLDDDTQVGQGALIDAGKGWVVAPLDIAREYEGRLFLQFDNGTQHEGRFEVLSSASNLALFVHSPEPLPVSRSCGVLFSDPSIETGALIAASGGKGKLIVGGVSAIESSYRRWHQKPVRSQIDKHLTSFGVFRDNSPVSSERVILCDLDIDGECRGAPVFSLQGDFVGLAVSRIDLSETVLVPAETIRKSLLSMGKDSGTR